MGTNRQIAGWKIRRDQLNEAEEAYVKKLGGRPEE
jgi:hypothetical protein